MRRGGGQAPRPPHERRAALVFSVRVRRGQHHLRWRPVRPLWRSVRGLSAAVPLRQARRSAAHPMHGRESTVRSGRSLLAELLWHLLPSRPEWDCSLAHVGFEGERRGCSPAFRAMRGLSRSFTATTMILAAISAGELRCQTPLRLPDPSSTCRAFSADDGSWCSSAATIPSAASSVVLSPTCGGAPQRVRATTVISWKRGRSAPDGGTLLAHIAARWAHLHRPTEFCPAGWPTILTCVSRAPSRAPRWGFGRDMSPQAKKVLGGPHIAESWWA